MVGPLPPTVRGNRYLLVMIDFFTKWAEIVPVRSQVAETIIPGIFNDWIVRHGVSFDTDQGSISESREFLSGAKYTSHTLFHLPS